LLNPSSVMPTIGRRSKPTISVAPSTPPAGITWWCNRSVLGTELCRVRPGGPRSTRNRQIEPAMLSGRRADPLAEVSRERCNLRPIKLGPTARCLDRGPDPTLSRADRAGGLAVSARLHGPRPKRRKRVAASLSEPPGRRAPAPV
jgi:hypothetical protein